jgi:hypothetical protein
MKPKATDRSVSSFSSSLTQLIGKSFIIYLLSAVAVPVMCFIFGWRSLDTIGSGFIYGSLGLALFGAAIFLVNTMPARLSRLSLPKYNVPSQQRHQEAESDGPAPRLAGIGFFFTTLICGALLFLTGLFLKML